MAGAKQPIQLLEVKGSKHLTKAEIEERKNSEIQAPDDNIVPPTYLKAAQKKEFNQIAQQLKELKIISNLDCEVLARYIKGKDEYIKITKALEKIKLDEPGGIDKYNTLSLIQNRLAGQVMTCAKELGLTVSSRCKLVIPKPKEKKENKFGMYAK